MQGGVVMEDAIIISKLSFDYDGIKSKLDGVTMVGIQRSKG